MILTTKLVKVVKPDTFQNSIRNILRTLSTMELNPFPSFGTKALHAGQEPEKWKSQAVVPPISMSTTFKQFGPGQHTVSFLSRLKEPANAILTC